MSHMNDLVKRKKDMEEEFDEIIEMESDLINTKSNMTITTVGKLLEKFNEVAGDLIEIINKKDNYDTKLKEAIESAIGQVADKFSQIQPPTINVTPNVKFDLQLLQPVLDKLGDQNSTLINLVSKYNSNQNENLLKLITSYIEKLTSFLDKDVKQLDYTSSIKGLENAINNRPTEFKSKVTGYSNNGRIEEITTKITKHK